MKDFLLSITAIVHTVGSWFGLYAPPVEQPQPAPTEQVRLGAINFVGTLPTTLSGSGVTASAVSAGVVSMSIQQTGQLLTMADFGSIGYITFEPGVASRQEFASFTGITQNSNGSAVLTGITRGLSPISPYTASSSLRFPHGGGTKVIVSNSPPFYDTFANKQNAASITGQYTFASTAIPQMATNTTDAQLVANGTSSLATINYVNNVAVSGAANATEAVKGIVELGTAIETASSTIFGATGASTVVQTKYSSSSPVTGCNGTVTVGSLCNVVAQNDGKINTNYIGTSSAYTYNWGASSTFSGILNITGTPTFTSTTTVQKPIIGVNHFGGTGADGALAVSSGVTTIDLGGAGYFEKNYTSISITGTGIVNFSNPSPNGSVIVLKSQGACTLTSSAAPMLTATGTGSVAGYSKSLGVGGSGSGVSASSTIGAIYGYSGGTGSTLSSTAVTAASVPSLAPNGFLATDGRMLKYSYVMPGAGGGSGSGQSDGTGAPITGAGGRGGGALIMECAGAWNFTTTNGISVQGISGTNGTYSGTRGEAIGGAGGGAGEFLGLYNYLTANTGTVNVSGGSNGTTVCTIGAGINGSSGAAGGNSVLGLGGTGSAGGVNSCGTSGSGANGTSTIMLNTQFN